MASWQVNNFNRSNKKNTELQLGVNISTATAYVEITRQTQELGVQYVSAFQGDDYNVYICKLPPIESDNARYKLFIKESN